MAACRTSGGDAKIKINNAPIHYKLRIEEMSTKPWSFQSIAPAEVASQNSENVPGRWKSGLFDCFSNIGMCCCVLWCQPCTVGQVQSISRGGATWACLLFTIGIITFNFGGQISNALWQVAVAHHWNEYQTFEDFNPIPFNTFAQLFLAAASLCTCLGVWNARAAYRRRDQIPGECGILSDCLAAWFCSPCSVCQMFSQDEITFAGSGGRPYKLFWSTYSSGVKDEKGVLEV